MLQEIFYCFSLGPGFSVRAIRSQGIVHVYNGKQTGSEWNVFPLETTRISAPVPTFVMAVRDVNGWSQVLNGSEHVVSQYRVLVHDFLFFGGQAGLFEENMVGDGHFANVVQ